MHTEFSDAFVRKPTILSNKPALVLNADYRPLSYFPLSLWSWQDAIKATFLERVDVISEYEECVHSPSTTIRLPSVIVLRDFVKPAKSTAFTRFNLFLRDEFTCQYCGSKGDMTFDHVVKTSIFISDMDDFAAINEVYGEYFNDDTAPARETVQVAKLPKNVNVEISMIAMV